MIDANQNHIKELSDEIIALRDIIHHLNIELSNLQAKNPPESLKSSNVSFTKIYIRKYFRNIWTNLEHNY